MDDADPAGDLYSICLAVARQHKVVLESLGNEPGCIDRLNKLKKELHLTAIAYVEAYDEDHRISEFLTGKQ